jgi:hypothetical protein
MVRGCAGCFIAAGRHPRHHAGDFCPPLSVLHVHVHYLLHYAHADSLHVVVVHLPHVHGVAGGCGVGSFDSLRRGENLNANMNANLEQHPPQRICAYSHTQECLFAHIPSRCLVSAAAIHTRPLVSPHSTVAVASSCMLKCVCMCMCMCVHANKYLYVYVYIHTLYVSQVLEPCFFFT